MDQRSILLGCAALLGATGCGNDDGTKDPWMATGMADGGTGADDGGDDGGGGGPCSLDTDDAPLTLSASGDSVSGRVAALAIAGAQTVACGDGFVALASGGSVEIAGRCTGLVALDDSTVVAVTDSGTVALVDVSGPSVAATAEAAGPAFGVAVGGSTVGVALGSSGVATFDTAGGTLGSVGTGGGSLDVRAIAASDDGWLVGGPGHITALGGDGAAGASLEIRGSVTDIAVDGSTGVVARGPFGFDIVDTGGGLAAVASVATEGSAVDVAMTDGAALVATGAAVSRYELSDGAAVLSARAPRPDEAQLVGEWVRAVATGGDTAVAAVGSAVHGLTLGGGSGAVAMLPRTTTSVFGEGDSEVVVLVRNDGNAELRVGELAVEGVLSIASVDGAEPIEGCEEQYAVAPGGSLLVTLEGQLSGEAATVELTAATSDPNHAALPLPIEVNRPSLAVGQPAPLFSLMTFGGDVISSDALDGEVVFLKLFSYS